MFSSLSGVRPSEQAEAWNKFHALSAEERRDREILLLVQSKGFSCQPPPTPHLSQYVIGFLV